MMNTIRKTAFAIACASILAPVSGQDTELSYKVEKVTISARSMSGIGATQTSLDSVALRGDISSSLAEVLSQNTSIFIKSYGRGSMASASFRGTAPSHTQVTWNGIKMNSPMVGMVDFSLIPSYFIDEAKIYHGASSVGISGGGLGGAISLASGQEVARGWDAEFIQGISSFSTFDEFLRVTYGNEKFGSSTRVSYASSDNDFKYVNYNKRDSEGGYPTERNKNGDFRDLHAMQEFYYTPDTRNRFGLSAWITDSKRGIPMLSVNYRDKDRAKNDQDEETLRIVGDWSRFGEKFMTEAKAGFVYSNIVYRYLGDRGTEELEEMIYSQSQTNSGFAQAGIGFYPSGKLRISADVQGYVHSVSSNEKYEQTGYDKTRAEFSGHIGAKYAPVERLGLGLDLREDIAGGKASPLIPAVFADYVIWPRYNVAIKASAAKNYRFPSMNDLYFIPGGNDSLRTEKGYTYEGGLEFGIKKERFSLDGEATLYDSEIKQWIVWLPSFKGFWSPVNVKKVHSYGVELKGKLTADLGRGWSLYMAANWARTRSVNKGDPASWNDESIGKQLVYVPEYSSGITGKLGWKGYALTYRYNYYSERFTTSSNETASRVDRLGSYYMNDVSVEKALSTRFAFLSLKLSVNNLFDEEYVSVLSRPMPGRNYGFYIGLRPRWKK